MTAYEDLGKLILRVSVAGMMLLHGIAKLMHFDATNDAISGMLAGYNLPGFIAYGVYVGEVIAPVLMIVGYFTRPAAIVFAFNMLVIVALAHRADVFKLDPMSGGWALEVVGLYLFGSIAVALLGPGRYSASGGQGRWD